MRSIKPKLIDEYFNPEEYIHPAKSAPILINSYTDLVKTIARLAYINKDHLLFFRGQSKEYVNAGGFATYYPSIYRGIKVPKKEVALRFDLLKSAASMLSTAFEEEHIQGFRDVKRRKLIQWSILQHYEVCSTPLIDVTQSLRVACSFAFLNANGEDPIVTAFGLPYITNRISTNSEHDIVNIRLLSICPPQALRPYFQDGYLAGTDDVTTNYDQKTELDFKNRVFGIFKLKNHQGFWRDDFDRIPEDYLYPLDDQVLDICLSVKANLSSRVQPERLGTFMQVWTEIESFVLSFARKSNSKVFSIREGIEIISKNPEVPRSLVESLLGLNNLRNKLVHSPDNIFPVHVIEGTQKAENTLLLLKRIKN